MNVKRAIFNIIDVVCKVVLVVVAVMFIIRAVRYAYEIGLQIFDQRPVSAVDTRTVAVTVNGSDSVSDIGKKLADKGLIEDARIFAIQERLSIYHDMIFPGTYELSPSMTADEMIEIMAAPAVEAREAEKAAEVGIASQSAADQDAGEADEEEEFEGDDGAGMAIPEEEPEEEGAEEESAQEEQTGE